MDFEEGEAKRTFWNADGELRVPQVFNGGLLPHSSFYIQYRPKYDSVRPAMGGFLCSPLD